MSQTILGIDLGSYSVKVLHLVRRVQELQVLNYIEEPLSLHTRLPHEEQITIALEKIFSNNDLNADVVCMSLPGHLLSSRILDLPFSNTKKINQVIDFELEGFIPFPIEEVFCDFHILSQSGNESQVLCVYMQEESFRKYHDSLIAANIDAKYFGADFTDLSGIAQIALVPHEGFYVICDIGHQKTNLLIMEGKSLRYVRTIGIAGYHFTRSIQRAFNLNFEKAEALKMSRGKLHVREEDSDQVSRILNRVARELVSSIKQAYLGGRHYYGEMSLPAIYCCGGGSKMIGIMDFLSFHLRTNVFELDSLNFINHQFEDPDEVNKVIPQVLSTAIRPIYSTKVPKINFRKGPYAYKQDVQFITKELKSMAVFFFVIILLGIGYYFYADHHYQKKIVTIDKKIDTMIKRDFKDLKVKKSRTKKAGSNLKKYLKAAKRKLNELKDQSPLSQGITDNVVGVMYTISDALPPKSEVNFEVKEFNFADDFVRLNATTNDTLNVEKIVASLQASGNFSNIESTDAQPKPGNMWDVTLKIDLKK